MVAREGIEPYFSPLKEARPSQVAERASGDPVRIRTAFLSVRSAEPVSNGRTISEVAISEGFEPPTSPLGPERSVQLSYETVAPAFRIELNLPVLETGVLP